MSMGLCRARGSPAINILYCNSLFQAPCLCVFLQHEVHIHHLMNREKYIYEPCVSVAAIPRPFFFTRGFSLCHAVGSTPDLKPSTLIKQSETLNLF